MGIVFLVLIFLFILGVTNNIHFTEFLVFSGTLIGSITAFYFSNAKAHNNRIKSDSTSQTVFCKRQTRKKQSNLLRSLCGRYI
jgi:positive regulator of sigma E activity